MFSEILRKFLTTGKLHQEEKDILLSELKNMALSILKNTDINSIQKIYVGDRFQVSEDIVQEILVLMYTRKDKFLKAEGDNLYWYVKSATKNHLIDTMRKRYIETEEIKEEVLLGLHSRTDELMKIEAHELLKNLTSGLSKKEIYLLCLYLTNRRDRSAHRNRMDKAISRLRRKIKNICLGGLYSYESVEYCLNYLIVSEVCRKLVYIRKEYQK